ncbi:hypothetical protein FXO38_18496 [Capsicum annuum]|nr:hypothetical protein FXO38_18496 [Capsicum annuum]
MATSRCSASVLRLDLNAAPAMDASHQRKPSPGTHQRRRQLWRHISPPSVPRSAAAVAVAVAVAFHVPLRLSQLNATDSTVSTGKTPQNSGTNNRFASPSFLLLGPFPSGRPCST